MAINPDVYRAVDRLYNNPDFRVFREFLLERRSNELMRAVMSPDNTDVLRGRAQELVYLCELIESSTLKTERLENKRYGKVNTRQP